MAVFKIQYVLCHRVQYELRGKYNGELETEMIVAKDIYDAFSKFRKKHGIKRACDLDYYYAKEAKNGMRSKVWKEQIKRLRDNFPAGCRVELIRMDDPQGPPIGTLGTVVHVDDIGTIHVNWDNGSHLGVVYGEDDCRRID